MAVDLIARLAEDPPRAALFLDVDGVLAPIVARPEDARVPDGTRAELRRLHDRYALVACITGRASDDARKIVGVPELTYVGNHGHELAPESEAWHGRLRELLSEVEWPHLEDKGLTATLHYRGLDEAAVLPQLEAIAERSREAGFVARFGRKALEIIPPIEANKGTAIRMLLARHELRRALASGDDTTDLDAFRALDGLELAVRVAVSSEEGPPELRAAADIVVANPPEFVSLLQQL
ncbi:MAG: trehalose-phosphatase [Actinobacteria bacterium]|nr:trehalose-phosphatase [Actinomycetota bacterium]